jgi:hypothetical protein
LESLPILITFIATPTTRGQKGVKSEQKRAQSQVEEAAHLGPLDGQDGNRLEFAKRVAVLLMLSEHEFGNAHQDSPTPLLCAHIRPRLTVILLGLADDAARVIVDPGVIDPGVIGSLAHNPSPLTGGHSSGRQNSHSHVES